MQSYHCWTKSSTHKASEWEKWKGLPVLKTELTLWRRRLVQRATIPSKCPPMEDTPNQTHVHGSSLTSTVSLRFAQPTNLCVMKNLCSLLSEETNSSKNHTKRIVIHNLYNSLHIQTELTLTRNSRMTTHKLAEYASQSCNASSKCSVLRGNSNVCKSFLRICDVSFIAVRIFLNR